MRSRVAPTRAQVLALLETFRAMRRPALVQLQIRRRPRRFRRRPVPAGGRAQRGPGWAQLSWRHGHLPHSASGILDAFFAAWAEAEGKGKVFEDWVREDYDPASLTRRLKTGRLQGFVNDRILTRE